MTIPGGRLPCRGEFIRPPSSARPVTSGSPTSWVTHWPVAIRRSELARDQAAGASIGLKGGALKATRTSGFALLGESLFPNAEKVTKNACPCIRVSLRSTPLIPSTLRGPAYKGHPCRRRPRPFTPLAASMPLAPLHADSIRPPERGLRRRLLVSSSANKQSVLLLLFAKFQTTRTQSPFRRPSVGAAQGDARHGCRGRTWPLYAGLRSFVGWKTTKHFPPRLIPQLISDLAHQKRWVSFALPTLRSLEDRTTGSLHGPSDATKSPLSEGRSQVARKGLSGMDAARAVIGHGWPFTACPWSVTGVREVERSETRMQGQDLLVPFGATAKRDSPSRAKPMPQPTSAIGRPQRSESQIASRAMTRGATRPNNPTLSSMPRRSHPVAPRCDSNEKSPLLCA